MVVCFDSFCLFINLQIKSVCSFINIFKLTYVINAKVKPVDNFVVRDTVLCCQVNRIISIMNAYANF